jgi:hypothetical protein
MLAVAFVLILVCSCHMERSMDCRSDDLNIMT